MTFAAPSLQPRRVLLLGATGTIGRATARALAARGHHVICPVRPDSRGTAGLDGPGIETRRGEVTDPASLARDILRWDVFVVLL
jgi:divinyl chlorophyllide a 8-vinyl-reductase